MRILHFCVIVFALCGVLALASCSSGGGLADDKIPSGFDDYGLNEVAGLFSGSYFNNYSYRPPYEYDPWAPGDDAAYLAANPGADSHWAWDYRTTDLLMKWNKAWPNEGGWITNHMKDSYELDGVTYQWEYFTKIVWVGPAPANEPDPYQGYRIWGDFAVIQEVYNDPGQGFHGNVPIPGPNGFGAY